MNDFYIAPKSTNESRQTTAPEPIRDRVLNQQICGMKGCRHRKSLHHLLCMSCYMMWLINDKITRHVLIMLHEFWARNSPLLHFQFKLKAATRSYKE